MLGGFETCPNMCKLLVLYRGDTSTISSIKEDFPALLGSVGVEVNFCNLSNITQNDLLKTDSVMLVRSMDPAVVGLIKRLKRAGVFVIAFYDDDLLNLPDTFPSIGYQLTAMRKILSLSDAILTSSPLLKEKYAKMAGTRSYLMHTAVSEEIFRCIPSRDNPNDDFSIVYAAGSGHACNIERYIVPILRMLGDRYGDRLSIEFVGVRPKIRDNYGLNITFTEGMPIDKYREYMKKKRFDLGLAVLEQDPFSECKYFNKFIEYTIVGTVGMYSNCKPYTYAVKDGNNGFLVENNPEKWYERICYIIDNKKILTACLENAVNQLRLKHSIDVVAQDFIRDMPEVLNKREQEERISLNRFKIEDRLYVFITIIYHYCWHARREGIGWFKNRLKNKLRV